MTVKRTAERRPIRSPKFKRPIAKPPRTTVKFNQDKNVRSLAKNTLGSTLTGSAIRLPALGSKVLADMTLKGIWGIREEQQEERTNKKIGKKKTWCL